MNAECGVQNEAKRRGAYAFGLETVRGCMALKTCFKKRNRCR
jgi:hypothetical protein